MKLAAVSYDSLEILKDFADRHTIEFPLLADPDSKIIRSFYVLNEQAKGITKGMAHPGFFYIDRGGVIREKYFEAQYTNRFTANNVFARLFPELTQEVGQNVQAPHLRLTLAQSDETVVAGSRVTLSARIDLPPDTHVYAPGVTGYKPILLMLHSSRDIAIQPPIYPDSKALYLEAIKQQVPVFEGTFRIHEDVILTVSKVRDGARSLVSAEKTASIRGELQYQACDKTTCYPPTSLPVVWHLKVEPLDRKRSPAAIQHK